MANLHPFRAYRFNPEITGDLEKVVTQPYDKISTALQEEYYRRSPYNVVRVTKNYEKIQDPDTDYPDAAATFLQWLEQKALIQDSAPGFYAYDQEYEIDGERKVRRGFVGLLDLKHSGSAILPHERTLAEPKMDRLRLMRCTESNDDLIFMIYTDDKLAVNRLLEESLSGTSPEIRVKDDYGAMHKLWQVNKPEMVKKIQAAMVPEELFIADGHHRFETALNYMKECEGNNWKPAGTESFDKRMVACFNSADEGLTILPTHRLVRDLANFDSQRFLKASEQYFLVEPADSAEALWNRMKENRANASVFGFYARDIRKFILLRLKEESKTDPVLLAHSEVYRDLDVSILHTLILERLLGIDEAKLVAQAHVDYARDRTACIGRVDQGEYQAVFFLNPTSVQQVQRVALVGERMPQKSTDFYPKLLTGLLFMKMEIKKK
jgi:uncharacterized protein (DUF1015 family)